MASAAPITFRFSTATDMRAFDPLLLERTHFETASLTGLPVSFAGQTYDSRVTYTGPEGSLTLIGDGLSLEGGRLVSGDLRAIMAGPADGDMDGLWSIAPFNIGHATVQMLFDSGTPEAGRNLRLMLTDSPNRVFGSAGADVLYGHEYGDTLRGGAGDDRMFGGVGADRLFGGKGDDQMNGGIGRDSLGGGSGNDRLNGGLHGDRLTGASGDDTLRGGAGADTLSGGAGVDQLRGGAGNDHLTGGGGIDRFIFRNHDGQDTIAGFVSGSDRIVIELAPTDPQDIQLRFSEVGEDTRVQFLDVTLLFLDTHPDDLNFAEGGDFSLVPLA